MSDSTEFYTIGQLARRTGLPVHTIRFWSDSGVVPPTGRSDGGYRLYDAAAVARFDLVRTLCELGIGLEDIQEILARQVTVAELVADQDFRRRLRRIVLSGSSGPRVDAGFDLRRLVLERAGRALADGVAPESAEGGRVLGGIIGPGLSPAGRAELCDRLRMLADAQVERYWELLGVLNGREPSPSVVPAFDWVIAALGVHR